jgi:hypothetical protein
MKGAAPGWGIILGRRSPLQAWPGRISFAKPTAILHIEGQGNVSRGRVAGKANDRKRVD